LLTKKSASFTYSEGVSVALVIQHK